MLKKNCEISKIVGALAVAGATALFSSFVASNLYAAGGAEAAAPASATTPATAASTAPDAKAGEQVAKKCAACHTFTKGGKNGVGPNQFGLIGREVATVEGFTYSPALTALKGKKWDEKSLSEFITDPKKYAAGTKMAFPGIKDDKERANLIAYLKTLK